MTPAQRARAIALAALLGGAAAASAEGSMAPYPADPAPGPEAVSLLGRPLAPMALTDDRRGALEADLRAARTAHDEAPEDEDRLIWLGRRLAYLGRYRDAVAVFSRGLELHPESFRLRRHRGHRYITLRRFAQAIADLSRAAELTAGVADAVEPDGAPNRFGIPRSTNQSNIWYHLGLAHYLSGDFAAAHEAYTRGLEVARVNDDMLVATTHWAYMTLRRLGRAADAEALLAPIRAEMDILENHAYHRLLRRYKAGEMAAEHGASESIEDATFAYGVGNWHLYGGDQESARAVFRGIVAGPAWPAFGFIAAEAELARGPLTRAEATGTLETSSHTDVVRFLDALGEAGADFTRDSLATSTGGRDVPLIVVADPPVAAPTASRRDPRAVVYVQGNIHGGEVEGKEAALMLLRDLLPGGAARPLLRDLILLVAPIYNPDGNDDLGPAVENRRHQNGPERIGRRPNGMGLDLNRDCMKAESEEMRGALARVYTAWDPDLVIDLHTTDGTRHGYGLTYSPPLSPNTPPDVLALTRATLLPEVRREMRERHGIETFDYGNATRDEEPPRWLTFSPDPRFVTNYVGLRNRVAVLSEAMSHLPFSERIVATDRFLRTVLAVAARHREAIVAATRAADRRVTGWGEDPASAPPLGVRFEAVSRGRETVLLERGWNDPDGAEGTDSAARTPDPARFERHELEAFVRFAPTRTTRLPAAYLIPASLPEAVALIARHGIVLERLEEAWRGPATAFTVTEMTTAERPFQGHHLNTLEGEHAKAEVEVAAGAFLVQTAQPLAILAFQLLEAESTDGLAAWGYLDRSLRVGARYPILKLDRVPVVRRRLHR